MNRNFADWYSTAVTLRPTGQELTLRWEAVQQVAATLKLKDIPALVRLFYGRGERSDLRESLEDAVKTKDPAFLVQDNNAELGVLAGGIISELLREGSSTLANGASIGTLSMEFCGFRKDRRLQGVVDEVYEYLSEESVEVREPTADVVDDLEEAEVLKAINTVRGSGQLGDVAAVFNALETTVKALLSSHAGHTASLNRALADGLGFRDEQLDILWWLFSEHSLDGTIALADLTTAEVCLVTALDLAKLTKILPGPPGAGAFLKKALALSGCDGAVSLTLVGAVHECNLQLKRARCDELAFDETADLCPALFAMVKSVEAEGTGWIKAFETQTGLPSDLSLSPMQLASQIYTEALFLRAMRA